MRHKLVDGRATSHSGIGIEDTSIKLLWYLVCEKLLQVALAHERIRSNDQRSSQLFEPVNALLRRRPNGWLGEGTKRSAAGAIFFGGQRAQS